MYPNHQIKSCSLHVFTKNEYSNQSTYFATLSPYLKLKSNSRGHVLKCCCFSGWILHVQSVGLLFCHRTGSILVLFLGMYCLFMGLWSWQYLWPYWRYGWLQVNNFQRVSCIPILPKNLNGNSTWQYSSFSIQARSIFDLSKTFTLPDTLLKLKNYCTVKSFQKVGLL